MKKRKLCLLSKGISDDKIKEVHGFVDFLYFEMRLTVRRISCGVLGGIPLTEAFGVLPNAILAGTATRSGTVP